MGNLYLLLAAPAAVLAAIIFWRVFDTQHADYEIKSATITSERAQFNKEFSKAWDGHPDDELKAAAAEAKTKLKKLEAEQQTKKAAAMAAGKQQADRLDALLNYPTDQKKE